MNHPVGNPVTGSDPNDDFLVGDGNVIQNCVVDSLWGDSGWCIQVASNNPSTDGTNGTFTTAVIDSNTVTSNGLQHQGFGSWGTTNTIWSNNVVTGCAEAFFDDSGFNTNDRIVNNVFNNNRTGIFLGGGNGGIGISGSTSNGATAWQNLTISGNTINVPPQQGFVSYAGIQVEGSFENSNVSSNQILAMPGLSNGIGLQVTGSYNYDNAFTNNYISSILQNTLPSSAGYAYNNQTETGGTIPNSGDMLDSAVYAPGNNVLSGSNDFSGTDFFSGLDWFTGGLTASGTNTYSGQNNFTGAVTFSQSPTVTSGSLTLANSGGGAQWSLASSLASGSDYTFSLYDPQNSTYAMSVDGATDTVTLSGSLAVPNGLIELGPSGFASGYGRMLIGRDDGTYDWIETIDGDRNLRLDSGYSHFVVVENAYVISSTSTALTVQQGWGDHYIDFLDPAFNHHAYIDAGARLNFTNLQQLSGTNPVLSGTLSGSTGDVVQQTNGAPGSTLFVKESGTNTTSGWNAVPTYSSGSVVVSSSFNSMTANTMKFQDFAVSGATVTDGVVVVSPTNFYTSNAVFDGIVRTSGTVTLRAHNLSGTNTLNGTFGVLLLHHQ